MSRGAVDSSMHYNGLGQLRTELSTAPRDIVLTILPNGHEITALLPNLTRNHLRFCYKIDYLLPRDVIYARDILRYARDVDVIGHGIVKLFHPVFALRLHR